MNDIAENQDVIIHKARSRIGSILNGKYRLDHLLGVGGTAAVYAATHRNGNRVAIKILHSHLSFDGAVAGRLQQEGYVANLIEHPGALRVMDDDRTEDGSLYLIMELLQGEGLDTRLRRKNGCLPPPEALGIIASVLDVLAAAHARGVVHRDVKPDNIFITREGDIKVLDFGLARLLDAGAGLTGRTGSGMLFGTPGFMAPEQALGRVEEIDARTDVWAVGATLFTLVTGRLVHEAATANEQLVKAATRSAPSLVTVMPGADAGLAAVVDGALAFQRNSRWQSALEMQEAVRTAAATMGMPAEAPLRGPRLSIEVDLDAMRAANPGGGPWRTTFPSVPPVGQEQIATVLSYPPPRGRLGVGMLVAAVAALVVGWLALRGSQPQPPEPMAEVPPVTALPAPPPADPMAVVPVPAVPADIPEIAEEPEPEPAAVEAPPAEKRPRARLGRRTSHKATRQPPPAAAASPVSVGDDDMWDRRE